MLQYQRRRLYLGVFLLATPAALFAQDAQDEASAEVQELAITGATLIDGTGAAPRDAPDLYDPPAADSAAGRRVGG